MRDKRMILLLLIAILNLGFYRETNTVYCKIHIIKDPIHGYAGADGLQVILRDHAVIIAVARTHNSGDVSLPIPRERTDIDVFCKTIGIDTLFVGCIRTSNRPQPDTSFYIPCPINKDSLNKVVCPKCHSSDKIYEVEYGEGMEVLDRGGHMDKSIDRHIFKGKFYAGKCTFSGARYFCDRDKIKFCIIPFGRKKTPKMIVK